MIIRAFALAALLFLLHFGFSNLQDVHISKLKKFNAEAASAAANKQQDPSVKCCLPLVHTISANVFRYETLLKGDFFLYKNSSSIMTVHFDGKGNRVRQDDTSGANSLIIPSPTREDVNNLYYFNRTWCQCGPTPRGPPVIPCVQGDLVTKMRIGRNTEAAYLTMASLQNGTGIQMFNRYDNIVSDVDGDSCVFVEDTREMYYFSEGYKSVSSIILKYFDFTESVEESAFVPPPQCAHVSCD